MAIPVAFTPEEPAPIAAGFEKRLTEIVLDWMRRRRIPADSSQWVRDPQRHLNYLIVVLCWKHKLDPYKLWAGHDRTRKRLQKRVMAWFGLYDGILESSADYWLQMELISEGNFEVKA